MWASREKKKRKERDSTTESERANDKKKRGTRDCTLKVRGVAREGGGMIKPSGGRAVTCVITAGKYC